jgi:hypothetical protein
MSVITTNISLSFDEMPEILPIVVATTDDNYEENDTQETAYDLTLFKGILLSEVDGEGISYENDQDWYKITIGASETYFSTYMTFPYNSRYIDLELYTPDGIIVSSAAYRAGTISEFRREINTVLSPSEYYLRVNSLYSYSGQVSNTYNLLWSTKSLSDANDEYEDNDTLETATDVRNP